MSNIEFFKLSEDTLLSIIEIIEREDTECLIDLDFQGDIINLTTDKGIFVINRHSAAKELWLASPISGPHHFFHDHSRWVSKSGNDLFYILESELGINFSKNLRL